MCPPLPFSAVSSVPETAAAFRAHVCSGLWCPGRPRASYDPWCPADDFLSQVCSEGSLRPVRVMVWELQGKAVTLVRTLLTLSSWKSLRGNGKGRMAGCREAVQSTNSPSYFVLMHFSVWIIGPFREVAWKWLILAWEWSTKGPHVKGSSRSWGLAALDHKTRPRCPQPWLPAGTRAFIHIELTQQGALTVSNPGPASALRKCLLCIYREFPWW